MEEITSLILRGFDLVKDLEANLSELANDRPETLATSLAEITRTFLTAKQRLDLTLMSHQAQERTPPSQLQVQPPIPGNVMTQAMESAPPVPHRWLAVPAQVTETPESHRASSSSSQRARTRKEEEDRRTVRVPAPTMGNMDAPPEDNYTWRKYGQKEILGSRFPRAYYRCTHQKLYNCPAKKQVQRLDDDPFTFQVTYRGNHTCQVLASQPQHQRPLLEAGDPHEATTTTSLSLHPLTEFGLTAGGGTSVHDATQFDYPAVADMATSMFDYGGTSGGNTSMEFMFTSDQKHDDPNWGHVQKKD